MKFILIWMGNLICYSELCFQVNIGIKSFSFGEESPLLSAIFYAFISSNVPSVVVGAFTVEITGQQGLLKTGSQAKEDGLASFILFALLGIVISLDMGRWSQVV